MVQYMKIRYGVPFQIPRRLGDRFREIVGIKGVRYIRQQGFVVSDKSALDAMNRILVKMGLILVPDIRCFICGMDVGCDGCSYKDVCKRDAESCICGSCMSRGDIVKRYYDMQRTMLDQVLH